MQLPYRVADGAIWVELYAKPGASRTGWAGLRVEPNGSRAFALQIQAAPVDGAANDELIRFLAKELKKLSHSVQFTLIQGATGKRKRVKIEANPLEPIARYFERIANQG